MPPFSHLCRALSDPSLIERLYSANKTPGRDVAEWYLSDPIPLSTRSLDVFANSGLVTFRMTVIVACTWARAVRTLRQGFAVFHDSIFGTDVFCQDVDRARRRNHGKETVY